MRLDNLELRSDATSSWIQMDVRSHSPLGSTEPLYFRVPAEDAALLEPDRGDAFLAGMLPLAMYLGEPLEIDAPVSARLYASITTIQDVYQCWDPTFRRVAVEVPAVVAAESSANAEVGMFFSLGVDSTYTLVKQLTANEERAARLSRLVLIHFGGGGPGDESEFSRHLPAARAVAARVGCTLAPVQTNVRDLAAGRLAWGTTHHGAALAAVGLAVGRGLARMYVAASQTYATLRAWGSHPMLDPLWSTESLAFIHDGCEASRLDKLRLLCQTPELLNHLQVCYAKPTAGANCGRCEKCTRTRIGLEAIGAGAACATLPQEIDDRQIVVKSPDMLRFYEQVLVEFVTAPPQGLPAITRDRLCAAIHAAIERYEIDQQEERRWQRRRRLAHAALVPAAERGERVLLIDEGRFGDSLGGLPRPLPFLGRDGQYWGPPRDDAEAVRELQLLLEGQLDRVLVMPPAFWWLEHYPGLDRLLRSQFTLQHASSDLQIFVRGRSAPAAAGGEQVATSAGVPT